MSRTLVLLLAACCAATVPAQEVLVGVSADGRSRAYLSGELGLRVTGWPGAPGGVLHIGHGSAPRFDARGDLFFARVTDDGHRILSETTLVVPAGTLQPRALRATEVAPPFRVLARRESGKIPIAVDAGHGGTDPGATGNGLLEKDVTLDVALRLKALLDLDSADPRGGGDWDVLMTRSTDATVSLRQRTDMANAFSATTFLSIHMNAFSSASAHGSETYCYIGRSALAAGDYRNRLHRELLSAWGLSDRGVKEANFHVLRESFMPAALVEGGFITNAGDAAKLADPAARQRLALGLLWATQEHIGYPRYTPSTPTTGELRGLVYDATKGSTAPIQGATVSLPDGTFASSNGNGVFAFTLSPGNYRFGVTAAGFAPGEASRTVVANSTVSGNIGLQPDNVPALRAPPFPAGGQPLFLSIEGDPSSPAFLLIGGWPLLPLVDFGGFGKLWPDTRVSVTLPVGTMPAGGVLPLRFTTPFTPGLRVHVQAFVRSKGALRTTNGAGIELR